MGYLGWLLCFFEGGLFLYALWLARQVDEDTTKLLRNVADNLLDVLKHEGKREKNTSIDEKDVFKIIPPLINEVKALMDSKSNNLHAFFSGQKSVHDRNNKNEAYTDDIKIERNLDYISTHIEVLPLIGIIGTLLPFGLSMAESNITPNIDAVSSMISYFGTAIWTSVVALSLASVLAFIRVRVSTTAVRSVEQSQMQNEMFDKIRYDLNIQ